MGGRPPNGLPAITNLRSAFYRPKVGNVSFLLARRVRSPHRVNRIPDDGVTRYRASSLAVC